MTNTQLPLLPLLAGLKANGVTPMKDGLLTALKEIVTNGKTPLSAFYSHQVSAAHRCKLCKILVDLNFFSPTHTLPTLQSL